VRRGAGHRLHTGFFRSPTSLAGTAHRFAWVARGVNRMRAISHASVANGPIASTSNSDWCRTHCRWARRPGSVQCKNPLSSLRLHRSAPPAAPCERCARFFQRGGIGGTVGAEQRFMRMQRSFARSKRGVRLNESRVAPQHILFFRVHGAAEHAMPPSVTAPRGLGHAGARWGVIHSKLVRIAFRRRAAPPPGPWRRMHRRRPR